MQKATNKLIAYLCATTFMIIAQIHVWYLHLHILTYIYICLCAGKSLCEIYRLTTSPTSYAQGPPAVGAIQWRSSSHPNIPCWSQGWTIHYDDVNEGFTVCKPFDINIFNGVIFTHIINRLGNLQVTYIDSMLERYRKLFVYYYICTYVCLCTLLDKHTVSLVNWLPRWSRIEIVRALFGNIASWSMSPAVVVLRVQLVPHIKIHPWYQTGYLAKAMVRHPWSRRWQQHLGVWWVHVCPEGNPKAFTRITDVCRGAMFEVFGLHLEFKWCFILHSKTWSWYTVILFLHRCLILSCFAQPSWVWISSFTHSRHISILGDDRS